LALATGEALTCFTELVRRAWQADFMVAAIVIKEGPAEELLALRARERCRGRERCWVKRRWCSSSTEPQP
jgi:hypothetical protein